MTRRFEAYFDRPSRCWRLIDTEGVPAGERPPIEKTTSLSTEQVLVLLEEVAKTDLINKVLAERVYSKDMANRHLDIIQELIVKIK